MSSDPRRGFVLARRPLGDHHLRVTLLLDDGSRLSVLAPSGQNSRERFSAGLSSLALYNLRITVTPRGARLDSARIHRAWPRLLTELRRQSASVAATGIADELSEPSPHDAGLFLLLGELYETLARIDSPPPAAVLVRFALEALAHAGHGLALDRCVRCDRPCPESALVTVDPSSGGVVCQPCGGGPYRLSSTDRSALRALLAGALQLYRPGLVLVTGALIAGFAPRSSGVLTRTAGLLGE